MSNVDVRNLLNGLKVPYKDRRSELVLEVCPFCSGDRKLGVNVEKGVYRCPKCEASGRVLDLYAYFAKGMDPAQTKAATKFERAQLYKEMVQFCGGEVSADTLVIPEKPMATIYRRDVDYQRVLDEASLTEEDRQNLRNRGLTDEAIAHYGYKSYPQDGALIAANMVAETFNVAGVPGFYSDQGKWKLKNGVGILIPVRDVTGVSHRGKGYIQGFQVRSPHVTENCPRYYWLSSSDKEEGTGANAWCHFAGWPEETVILTEGALKADIINFYTQKPVLAVMGVNSTSHLPEALDHLAQLGVARILVAFDMDYHTNPRVAEALARMNALLDKKGFMHQQLTWDPAYKGFDDYLHHKAQEKKQTS